jgi:hypothetical protein
MTAGAPATQPQVEHSGSAHAMHHEAAHPDADQHHGNRTGDCPHCPPGHDAANVAHASCSAATASATGSSLHKSPSAEAMPIVALALWVGPAVGAAPPLILGMPPGATRRSPVVPINIRHCVFLI